MELILVRHGSYEPTDESGNSDPALSQVGRREAQCVAECLGDEAIDAIYTSPLRRAVETAVPLGKDLALGPVVCHDIVEYDGNVAEHIPMELVKPEYYAALKEKLARYGDRVELERFRCRVAAAMQSIINDHRDQCVAVFCHASVVNAWAATVLDLPPRPFINVAYASISRFLCAAEASFVSSLNETQHLAPDP